MKIITKILFFLSIPLFLYNLFGGISTLLAVFMSPSMSVFFILLGLSLFMLLGAVLFLFEVKMVVGKKENPHETKMVWITFFILLAPIVVLLINEIFRFVQ